MNESASQLRMIGVRHCIQAFLSLWCLTALTAAGADLDVSFLPNLLTAEERRWLEAHPSIRVAPTPDYHPVEYFDSQGRHWGITSDYFNLLERRLGYRFKFVKLSPEQWQSLDPEIRGTDVVTASAETPNRAAYWNFTPAYLTFPTYLITRRGVEDGVSLSQLKGGRVAVVKGWAAEEYLRTTHPQVVVDPVLDAATGLRRVSFGLVDAFVSELPVATSWMEKEGITNLKLSGEAGYTYQLGISVRKDWPELHSILSKALASISLSEREQLYNRWVKIAMPANPFSERSFRALIWTGAGLAALLLGVLAWNRSLSSQVRTRTSQLQDELAARLEAAKALQASEEKFSKAFHASPIPIALSSLSDGRFLDINAAFTSVFGYTREESVGKTTSELNLYFRPEDRQRLREHLLTEGGVREWELPVRDKNGRERLALYSAQRLSLTEGNCVISLAQDITERKQADEALSTLLRRFEVVARATNDAVWDWDLESKTIWWYNGFQVLFGYRIDEIEPGIESWVNRLHPDDRERTEAGIYAVIDAGGKSWSDEYRFRRKDGSYAEVFDRGYVLRDEQGRAVRMIGAIQDISQRRDVERSIRESEKRYKDLFECNPNPMWVYDLGTLRFVAVNQAAVERYGYSREEFQTMVVSDLKAADSHTDSPDFSPIEPGVAVSGFARHRTKSGKFLDVETTTHTMLFGGLRSGVMLAHDVTEQRRAEADRQQLMLQLLKAEDEERRRIARELHDTTAQHLAAIQMNLTRLREFQSGEPAAQLLAESLVLAGQSVDEVRTLSYLLHPPLLEELGLAGALADYAAGFTKRSGVQVNLEVDRYAGRLPREVELVLFRVVQESLANVHRHSASPTALVRLERDSDEVRLEIQDNGRGIRLGANRGVGLRGMQERLRQVGGELDIESDSEGTTVLASVRIPESFEHTTTA